ncbi:hypothetical protein Q5752_003410 [Cryptotrichosporon argae]
MSGPSVAGGEDEEDAASIITDEEEDPLEHVQTHALEEYARNKRPPIEVLDHGQEADLCKEVSLGKQEYVWDDLTISIHIFGKAYFSARSLLPSDPSAFTVPAYPLVGASSLAISGPANPGASPPSRSGRGSGDQDERTAGADSGAATPARNGQDATHTPDAPVHARRSRTRRRATIDTRPPAPPASRRPIATAYDLGTAQVPSPAWTWVTPWMVNMREGTDDGGWRYNYVFRKRGWKAYAGGLGWGGWCRRREWVRLRAKVGEVEHKAPVQLRARHGHGQARLGVQGDEEEVVDAITRAMGSVTLDRERVELWGRWLRDARHEDKARMRDVLDRHGAEVAKAFTYASSRRRFADLLAQHNLPAPPERPF